MKKIIFCLIILSLMLSSVSAWLPKTYDRGLRLQYTEICPTIDKETFLSKHIPSVFKPSVSFACDFREKIEQDLGYDSSSNIERACYRACWDNDLEFNEFEFVAFQEPRCYCNHENSSIQIGVNHEDYISEGNWKQHFRCYYFNDETECGKTRFCSTHTTKEFCEELGGVWLLETPEREAKQNVYWMIYVAKSIPGTIENAEYLTE